MMFFMLWMAIAVFIPFFAPSLAVLAFGEGMIFEITQKR